MISLCPHCGRSLATTETLTKTRIGWVPTLCANGEGGPLPTGEAETISNHPHWYCSVVDGGRRGLLTGPYVSYEEAQANLWRAKRLAMDADYRAGFYAYGIASSIEEKRTVFGLGTEPEQQAEETPKPKKRSRRKVGAK